jgi:hypothetical protein
MSAVTQIYVFREQPFMLPARHFVVAQRFHTDESFGELLPGII